MPEGDRRNCGPVPCRDRPAALSGPNTEQRTPTKTHFAASGFRLRKIQMIDADDNTNGSSRPLLARR